MRCGRELYVKRPANFNLFLHNDKGRDKVIYKKTEAFISDALAFLAGCVMFGASVNIFITPGMITMGGFTGVSTTIGYFFDTPIGVMIILLNLPLLVLEYRLKGDRSALWRTLLGIMGTSVATDLLAALPYSYEDRLLCALLGGLLMGAGSGLLMRSGFTTGGSDLAAYIIRSRSRRFSTGSIIFVIDAVIIVASAVLTGSFEGMLFSFAAVWCYTTAFDKMLGGGSGAILTLIMSERYREIAEAVSERLHRGVTVLSSSGWYTGKERPTLLCVVKKRELYLLREIAQKNDPNAFVVISNMAEVTGEGFKKSE